MQSEKSVVKAIMTWLSRYKGDFYKVHGNAHQRSGEPDITGSILYKGIWIHFKLEAKRRDGKPSPLQIVRLRRWHDADKAVGIVTSIEDVVKVFDTYHHYKGGNSFEDAKVKYGLSNEYKIYP